MTYPIGSFLYYFEDKHGDQCDYQGMHERLVGVPEDGEFFGVVYVGDIAINLVSRCYSENPEDPYFDLDYYIYGTGGYGTTTDGADYGEFDGWSFNMEDIAVMNQAQFECWIMAQLKDAVSHYPMLADFANAPTHQWKAKI